MTFDEFFHHSFIKMDSSSRKSAPTVLSYPSSGSSSCGSLVPHPASSPDSSGFPLKEGAEDHKNVSSFTDEYVMVSTQSPSEYTSDTESESPIASCLINSGGSLVLEVNKTTVGMTPPHSPLLSHPCTSDSKPLTATPRKGIRSLPIPVPTQIHNYQRMEQNLQPAGLHGSTRVKLCCAKNSSLPSELATGGARPQQSSPESGATPQVPEPTLPIGTRTLLLTDIKDGLLGIPSNLHKRRRTIGDFRQFVPYNNNEGHIKRAISTARLSDMLLKAAYEATVMDGGSQESLCETDMDASPVTVFTMESPRRASVPADTRLLSAGSPNYKSSPWLGSRPLQRGNRKNSETEAMDDSPLTNVVFHPPQLPEDTLMEESHTDSLNNLRFNLAFVHCIMELAMSKDPSLNTTSSPDVSFLEQSMLTDQISLLSREWSYASQLVLYMKAEDFLSSALHSAKEDIKQGQLLPSATVKQVIRRLNDMYKCCVSNCRSLNDQLQNFLHDKQKLIDRFNGLTAEKLIYSHSVHMVQSAALDEMFHYGLASIQRYHKALVLMEGLSRILTEKNDIDSVEKCKQCIERRLSALHTF